MFKKITGNVLATILFLVGVSHGQTGQIKHRISLEPDKLQLITGKDYTKVCLGNSDIIRETGAPQLPAISVKLLVPAGKEYTDFSFTINSSVSFLTDKIIYPVQKPHILSHIQRKQDKISFTEPEPFYYNRERYPADIIKFTGTEYIGDRQIIHFLFHPVIYKPPLKELVFYHDVELTVHYAHALGKKRNFRRKFPISSDYSKFINSLVSNKEPENVTHELGKKAEIILPTDRVFYVIITNGELSPVFQDLADWKTRKGMNAKIVTVNRISSEFTGRDLQEKIRNFITHAYSEWGAEWILLGGDTGIIPDRKAFAMDCEMNRQGDNDIPCDLYYAALDGNWNSDNDDVFGEIDDDTDLYPEVYVGRASVENIQEARNYVHKLLTYECFPSRDYILKALFLAEILWNSPLTDAGVGKDVIGDTYFPERFQEITKLYESLGNETREAALNEINGGNHFINHDGHAWYSVLSCGAGALGLNDMDNLKNAQEYSVLYSIGCWPGAFDYDCIGERFICAPYGGGVAFIGNSRYGWGSPGNPVFGYSNRFDQQFYRYIFHENLYKIGAALAAVKVNFANRSLTENVYRWHQYQLNLLGDPEMPVWTDVPKELISKSPLEIPAKESIFPVTVENARGPVPGALVCVMKENEVYARGYTGEDGAVNFKIAPRTPGYMSITVTAQNYLPISDSIRVTEEGMVLGISNYGVEEITGNGDNYINPEEEFNLNCVLKNYSNEIFYNIVVTLETAKDDVTVTGSSASFGNISAGDSVMIDEGLRFRTPVYNADTDVPLSLYLRLDADGVTSQKVSLSLNSVSPEITLSSFSVDDGIMENSNNVIEPGEMGRLVFTIKNSGRIEAKEILISLVSQDPGKINSVPQSEVYLSCLDPDSVFSGNLVFAVDENCPEPEFINADVKVMGEGKYTFTEQVYISIGNTGFYDDCEQGESLWNHGGENDQWHLSTKRKKSGSYSFYCGSESTGKYSPDSHCYLETQTFIVEPNSIFSFWHWYEVATYGVNGVYVELYNGASWETLDFIGSGGALPGLPVGNVWIEERYNLSQYPAETGIKVRFRFVSDFESPGEGFYIDDVSIKSGKQQGIARYVNIPEPHVPKDYIIFKNYPNPFNTETTIKYFIPFKSDEYGTYTNVTEMVVIEIYNALGQYVKTLTREIRSSGIHTVKWYGTDAYGHKVASGVYICRIKVGSIEKFNKMLLLK